MGGRSAKSGLSSVGVSPTTAPSAMGGGSVSMAGATPVAPATPSVFQIQQQPPNMTAITQQAQQANAATFSATDNSPFHDLYNGRQYYQSQTITADQMVAIIEYLDDRPESGSLYSKAQNLNQALATAARNGTVPQLNANQQYMYRHLMNAMHNLGYNVNLTRYDHGEFINHILRQSGVKNADFSQMSIGQLQSALVGKTYGEERFLSTSYNDFKNSSAQSKMTFQHRSVRIEYKAKASTQAMMPGNGPAGALGEVLLAPSGGRQNMKIVGVRYDSNRKVRQKGTAYLSSQDQLVLTVEVD